MICPVGPMNLIAKTNNKGYRKPATLAPMPVGKLHENPLLAVL